MGLTLIDLKEIFGEVPQDPVEQEWFLTLNQGLVDIKGRDFLRRHKASLLNYWEYVKNLL